MCTWMENSPVYQHGGLWRRCCLGEKVMSSGLDMVGVKTYVTSSQSSHIGRCMDGSKAQKGFWNEDKLGLKSIKKGMHAMGMEEKSRVSI